MFPELRPAFTQLAALATVFAVSAVAAQPPTDQQLREAQDALFERLGVAEAWKTTKGDQTVLIGVIDSGFDYFHPDLRGQIQPGYYYAGGYHNDTYENLAHGTLVSSLIVARDDDRGMCGLAPQCRVVTASQGTLEHKLLILQAEFFRKNPDATLADFQQEIARHADELKAFGENWSRYQVTGAAEAVRYLTDRGVTVINISGGLSRKLCSDDDAWRALEEAFAYATDEDVVIVLSAGNTSMKTEDYPGSEVSVLVVGACTNDGKRWEVETDVGGQKIRQGSDFGRRLGVMAPVENLVICLPHEEAFYGRKEGPQGPARSPFEGAYKILPNGATSSAAPIVASLVALVRTANPELSATETVRIIEEGCDDLAEPGFDEYTGHGMVNFGRTMELVIESR